MADLHPALLMFIVGRHVETRNAQGLDPILPTVGEIDAITDLDSAVQYVLDTPWFHDISARVADFTAPGDTRTRLLERHAGYQQDLDSGDWRSTFSGKELFRDVVSYIYTPPQPIGSRRPRP
jgi:hypothetical protein